MTPPAMIVAPGSERMPACGEPGPLAVTNSLVLVRKLTAVPGLAGRRRHGVARRSGRAQTCVTPKRSARRERDLVALLLAVGERGAGERQRNTTARGLEGDDFLGADRHAQQRRHERRHSFGQPLIAFNPARDYIHNKGATRSRKRPVNSTTVQPLRGPRLLQSPYSDARDTRRVHYFPTPTASPIAGPRGAAVAACSTCPTLPRHHAGTAISANDGRDWRVFIMKVCGVTVRDNLKRCPTARTLLDEAPDDRPYCRFWHPASRPLRGILRFI